MTKAVDVDGDIIVSIVIVTYNSRCFMQDCLAPIYNKPGIEIIVVDNQSSDGTAEYLTANYPAVRVVDAGSNLGFARGNNLAFKYCTADTILLLNPDAFLEDVRQVYDLAEILWKSKNIAFVGPKLLNKDGSHQVGDAGYRDSVLSLAGHYFFLHKLIGAIPATYLTNSRLLQKPIVEVDWVCGACLMTKKSVINHIGGLDDSIFMYGEDVEWGERAKRYGMRTIYSSSTNVRHLQGAVQNNGKIKVSTKSLQTRQDKFSKRGTLQLAAFNTIVILGILLRYIIYATTSLAGKENAKTKKLLMIETLLHFRDETRRSK